MTSIRASPILVEAMSNVAPLVLPNVEDVTVNTADEFLEMLSPRYHRWRPEPAKWLFRGHADAGWKLLPTAMRGLSCFEPFGISAPAPTAEKPLWSVRIEALEALLLSFREQLYRSGRPVPLQGPQVARSESMGVWPMHLPAPQAYPLMALAQHYGLPTLMLDWTRRAFTAAYFAALEAARLVAEGGAPSHLAVWALHRDALIPKENRYASDILIYEAPTYENANFNAQQGALTVSISEEDLGVEEMPDARGLLKRHTLPTTEAPLLLRYLAEEGVDGATLFPGLDGLVRAMREKQLWNQVP